MFDEHFNKVHDVLLLVKGMAKEDLISALAHVECGSKHSPSLSVSRRDSGRNAFTVSCYFSFGVEKWRAHRSHRPHHPPPAVARRAPHARLINALSRQPSLRKQHRLAGNAVAAFGPFRQPPAANLPRHAIAVRRGSTRVGAQEPALLRHQHATREKSPMTPTPPRVAMGARPREIALRAPTRNSNGERTIDTANPLSSLTF